MTKATSALRVVRTLLPPTAGGLLLLLTGCASLPTWATTPPWKQTAAKEPTGPKDTVVLRGNGLEQAKATSSPLQGDLDGAKRLLEQGQFDKAEAGFHTLATNQKCPDAIREEAIFQEAECQRMQKKYKASEDTYQGLFKDFPSSQFTERADKGLFEIAKYWLQNTREEMQAYEEKAQGKRWLVMPASFVHFSNDMPTFDAEGHAVRVLEHIRMHEINTPLGEQALIYLGTIRFFRSDYNDADHYFTELYTRYPNSAFAPKALKQSIICKQLCTGGTEYDCRSVEESKKLIHTAQTAYSEFAKDDQWIQHQLISINLQQADRDFRVAEFYSRTKHPGSAYFYYELVRRCYPNTEYARKAAERIAELERQHGPSVRQSPPPQPTAQVPAQTPLVPDTGAVPKILPPSVTPR